MQYIAMHYNRLYSCPDGSTRPSYPGFVVTFVPVRMSPDYCTARRRVFSPVSAFNFLPELALTVIVIVVAIVAP